MNSDDVTRASRHIADYLSPVTRNAYSANTPRPADKAKPEDKAGKDDPADRKRQIHEALANHHKAVFHKDNTNLEQARKTSSILVDASKPEDGNDPKGR